MTRASPPFDGQTPGTPAAESRLTAVVRDHFDFVWRLLRRRGLAPADADDAAQQVFMIATRKLEGIEVGRERSFLYGTALRVAANARRSSSRRPEDLDEAIDAYVASREAPERRAELSRAWALLDELLAHLPDELSRVLTLAEIEQLEVKEIAALEEIPVGTAASRLRRARDAFDDLLRRAEHRNPFAEEER